MGPHDGEVGWSRVGVNLKFDRGFRARLKSIAEDEPIDCG